MTRRRSLTAVYWLLAIFQPFAALGSEEFAQTEAAALAGDPHSQFLMGLRCSLPQRSQNLLEAYAWFKSAAVRGYYRAAVELDLVVSALDRKQAKSAADVRYVELANRIANKPRDAFAFVRIEDAVPGCRFYISNRWSEPRVHTESIALHLKSGGVAWLVFVSCTAEQDAALRTRTKTHDVIIALETVKDLQRRFGNAGLVRHGPSQRGRPVTAYEVIAEIPAKAALGDELLVLTIIHPGVDKIITMSFAAPRHSFDSEVGEFLGLLDTFSYTPCHLKQSMNDFIKSLDSQKLQ